MTYDEAWKMLQSYYGIPLEDLDEDEAADLDLANEIVHVADYDYANGISDTHPSEVQ